MGKNLRFVLLGIQAVITLAFTVFIIQAFVVASGQSLASNTQPYLLPSLVHLWVALVAATLLCLFYRANIGAEARVLPLLFLMISLSNIKVLPLYQSITHFQILNPSAIAVLFHFSILFSSFLFLASALFQQTINPTKLGQYSFVAAASALFIAIITPVSPNTPDYLWEAGITNKLFLGVFIIINVLSVVSFLVAMFEEHRSRQTIVRCLAFIFMIGGNAMIGVSQNMLYKGVGLVLYTVGTTTMILVTRTYHIWT